MDSNQRKVAEGSLFPLVVNPRGAQTDFKPVVRNRLSTLEFQNRLEIFKMGLDEPDSVFPIIQTDSGTCGLTLEDRVFELLHLLGNRFDEFLVLCRTDGT